MFRFVIEVEKEVSSLESPDAPEMPIETLPDDRASADDFDDPEELAKLFMVQVLMTGKKN